MSNGGTLCGVAVSPGGVIVVSEEPTDLWLDRRDRLGLGDHLEVLSRPFLTKPTRRDWEKLIDEAARALKQSWTTKFVARPDRLGSQPAAGFVCQGTREAMADEVIT